jgi:predicted AAA+ superfamily ATPase
VSVRNLESCRKFYDGIKLFRGRLNESPHYFEEIMYINELHIEKYKVLEDIHINLQVPKDNQNALNILAGPNGCGKTSLLTLLHSSFAFFDII